MDMENCHWNQKVLIMNIISKNLRLKMHKFMYKYKRKESLQLPIDCHKNIEVCTKYN